MAELSSMALRREVNNLIVCSTWVCARHRHASSRSIVGDTTAIYIYQPPLHCSWRCGWEDLRIQIHSIKTSSCVAIFSLTFHVIVVKYMYFSAGYMFTSLPSPPVSKRTRCCVTRRPSVTLCVSAALV